MTSDVLVPILGTMLIHAIPSRVFLPVTCRCAALECASLIVRGNLAVKLPSPQGPFYFHPDCAVEKGVEDRGN